MSTYNGCYASYRGEDARILMTASHAPGLFHIVLTSGPDRGQKRWALVGSSDDAFRPTQTRYAAHIERRERAA